MPNNFQTYTICEEFKSVNLCNSLDIAAELLRPQILGILPDSTGSWNCKNIPNIQQFIQKRELITIIKFLLYLDYYSDIFRFVILTHLAYSQTGPTGLLLLL